MRFMTLTLLMALSLWAGEFYKPSFDCLNVKENSIEYQICTDEKLSEWDRQLAGLYSDAVLVNRDAKQAQRDWLSERNSCVDTECIARHYRERIKELQEMNDAYAKGLKAAYIKAKKEYEKTRDVYKAIPLLENAGIRAIIEKRPSFLSEEAYLTYLEAYAFYYINTVEDTVHGNNLEYAQKILIHLTTIFPKEKELYLMLGRSYMDLFRFSARATFIHSFRTITQDSENWRRSPYLAKQAYLKYVQLCKEEGTQSRLTQEEQTIVKRDRMFMEYYSSFTGRAQRYTPPYYEESVKYKQGFENVCSEFVAMLNTLPDDNLTACSRYVNEKDSKFEYVRAENVPEQFRKYITNGEYVNWHLFKYKGEYFVDNYRALVAGNTFVEFMQDGARALVNMSVDSCDYQYVDLREERQLVGPACGDIRNYRDTYKIIR